MLFDQLTNMQKLHSDICAQFKEFVSEILDSRVLKYLDVESVISDFLKAFDDFIEYTKEDFFYMKDHQGWLDNQLSEFCISNMPEVCVCSCSENFNHDLRNVVWPLLKVYLLKERTFFETR